MKVAFAYLSVVLVLVMSACSREENPNAVIRVRIEGQSTPDKYMLPTEQETLLFIQVLDARE